MAKKQTVRTVTLVTPYRDPDGTAFVSFIVDQPAIGFRLTMDESMSRKVIERIESALRAFSADDKGSGYEEMP